VVIVDGQWGVVEDISLTYVLVRIWDLRRLIVPTSQFFGKSFQNWTPTTPSIHGVETLGSTLGKGDRLDAEGLCPGALVALIPREQHG